MTRRHRPPPERSSVAPTNDSVEVRIYETAILRSRARQREKQEFACSANNQLLAASHHLDRAGPSFPSVQSINVEPFMPTERSAKAWSRTDLRPSDPAGLRDRRGAGPPDRIPRGRVRRGTRDGLETRAPVSGPGPCRAARRPSDAGSEVVEVEGFLAKRSGREGDLERGRVARAPESPGSVGDRRGARDEVPRQSARHAASLTRTAIAGPSQRRYRGGQSGLPGCRVFKVTY
jgi:hypothetical protein